MIRNTQPSLSEILDDPIVGAVMRRDGVTREHVVAIVETVRRNLRTTGREPRPVVCDGDQAARGARSGARLAA